MARAAALAVAALTFAALIAGGVRVVPLLVDPELPSVVAAPFARAVAWLGLEVAVAVGWPVGWALAMAAFVDRGEARVHALLGQSPRGIVARFVPQSFAFALLLFACSFCAARDASLPGRVVGELLGSSRAECAASRVQRSVPVPFVDARWLCTPGAAPRIFVRLARAGGAALTASEASVTGDLRALHLEDARVLVGSADVRVGVLDVRGLPPLLTSATLPPLGRALAVTAMASLVAFGVAAVVLVRRLRSRTLAASLAIAGGGAGFAALRGLDRAGASPMFLVVVPAAALFGVLVVAGGNLFVSLRRKKATATTIWRANAAARGTSSRDPRT